MDRSTPTLLGLAIAAASAPALLAQDGGVVRGEAYVSPYAGRPVPGGDLTDDAVLAPTGEVFFLPADTAVPAAPDEELVRAPSAQPDRCIDRGRLHVTDQSTGIWVRGATYKACVHETGFTYVPFLGSTAPKNYPTRFRLASATVGGVALELDAVATVERHGDRFVLDRGPVDVVYDVALDFVEQSFHLDVAGRDGDLVLTLDVDSELDGAPVGAGLAFRGPEGGMDYGAAVALDGAGRVADATAELTGESLRLTVPAAFLAVAEGPIVVDPILYTYAVDSYGGDQTAPDVAYDYQTDTFTYVFEDAFSATDADLYRSRHLTDGTFVDGGYVEISSEDWVDPSIAGVHSTDFVLIVATRTNATTGFSEIVGIVHDVPDNRTATELVIGTGSAGYDNARPDVGGSTASLGGGWFVVWERRFSATVTLARGRFVSDVGVLGPTLSFTPTAVDLQQEEVVISKSTGHPLTVNVWNVAMRQQDLATDTDTIQGLQLNASGAVTNPISTLYAAPGGHRLHDVDVSDALVLGGLSSPTYLVAFDDHGPTDRDVELLVCRDNAYVNRIDLNEREHAITERDQDLPRLGTTLEDFVVTYLEHDPETGRYDVFCTTLDLTLGDELGISERRLLLGSTGGPWRGGAAIASRFSGGNVLSRYLGVGFSHLSAAGTDYDVAGLLHVATLPLTQAVQYCSGTPNSTGDRGFVALYGTRSPWTFKLLVASALPPFSYGYFLTSQDLGAVPSPGGSQGVLCLGGSIGRYSNFVTSSGPAGEISLPIDPTMLSQPTGSVPALSGQRWQFQLWHRDSVGGKATSNFTNAVSLLFE